jgi:putative transposase
MEWGRLLAFITGTVDQELLLRNEYLAAENRILRGQLKGRPRLSEGERATLGEIGRRLGRKCSQTKLDATEITWVSRPMELHHRPLVVPSVKLSLHSAPIR